MREVLVTELVKEVLGPRSGINEILNENPLSEYITGVLAPIAVQTLPEIDNEAEIPSADTQSYEDETDDVEVNIPPLLYPALDPKRKPSTMGLSFMVEAPNTPIIDLCITWARYKAIPSEKKGDVVKWQRQPKYSIFQVDLDSTKTIWMDAKGKLAVNSAQAEISVHIIVRHLESKRHFVHLYVVNRLKKSSEQDITAEDHIFQPQIRLSCTKDSKLVPRVRNTPRGMEDQRLEFLYRGRPSYARGHLCSAVWKDIDPENSSASLSLDFPECRSEIPFAWLDGQLVSVEQRRRFSHPDIRSEFVPVYSIPYPQLDWANERGRKPELNAQILAETWDIQELNGALTPLIEEYEKWIRNNEQQMENFSEQHRIIAEELVGQCKTVLARMKNTIACLSSDEDAKLAFCFANKAIDLQWTWSRKSHFEWRPFQMAFILMTLESIVNPQSTYRHTCDLLWVPTGAGKTEAYLAILAFTIAYKRRRALRRPAGDRTGAGVAALTRYTLRLLTIQQFRRTLSLTTACESLRVDGLFQKKPVGWRPQDCKIGQNFLWGSMPFMTGLWVGGGVSPNRMRDIWSAGQNIPGALSILKGQQGEGEPAQVLNCPACAAVLAVPEMGLSPGLHRLHFIVRVANRNELRAATSQLAGKTFNGITVERQPIVFDHHLRTYCTLTFEISTTSVMGSKNLDDFWSNVLTHLRNNGCDIELAAVRASRLGYFVRYYRGRGRVEYDFEIFCPNPECPLHKPWCAGAPSGWIHGGNPSNLGPSPDGISIPLFVDGNRLTDIQEPFLHEKNMHVADRIPIPAGTVEEQVYRRLPTIVVATVDKFARPPFDPQAATLFGNVEYHHCIYGYYRQYQPSSPPPDVDGHPSPAGSRAARLYHRLNQPLENPELIIQDELHLVEGPLGSLVGMYETAIDFLCGEGKEYSAKYIASTATIRRAKEQTQAIFSRELQLFPPHGLTVDDRFFICDRELHSLEDSSAGRLYVGVCAPGRGPLTPIVRVWARLLQTVWQHHDHNAIDTYWTLTGYFNAIRELAGARALYRQDIPQRVNHISTGNSRRISDEGGLELSSNTPPTNLPAILDMLSRHYPAAPDALFTTSMFGTGVDISRIGLMVVNGQPKTTAAYIQSTGRVGRSRGALVVTFFRASRPRDLNHYEFFVGYHRQLHRFVEPATVYPFSPGVLERAAGPISVFILRNMRSRTTDWHRDDSAPLMANCRTTAQEVLNLPHLVDNRAQSQPTYRKPLADSVRRLVDSKLDAWQLMATNNRNLRYVEYAITTTPEFPVVLGDYQHQHAKLGVVYENAPRSLRDIEETTGFQVR